MRGLQGRVALVTGATGLLGAAIAKRLAAEQAMVAVASRSLAKAEHWVAENKSFGRFIPVELDLNDEKSIHDCMMNLERQAGNPSIVVANASQREGLEIPFDKIKHDSFSRLFSVDIAGHILLLREFVKGLKGQPASIVFLSSIYGRSGVDHGIYPDGMLPAPVQYASVKSAVEGAVRWLAAAWGELGVRVNGLVPGGVASHSRQSKEFVQRYAARTMLRRMASAEEIASAAAFLASDDSSYMTGQSLVVDGGFTAW
jgi:NAD(P)-dependent dehydrogenase (short-subunit alcohol dehydrogenase family)